MCLDRSITERELSRTEKKNLKSGIAYKMVKVWAWETDKKYRSVFNSSLRNCDIFKEKNNIATKVMIKFTLGKGSYISGFHAHLNKKQAFKNKMSIIDDDKNYIIDFKIVKIKFNPKEKYTLGKQWGSNCVVVNKFDIIN
jgi:hypothetical protein